MMKRFALVCLLLAAPLATRAQSSLSTNSCVGCPPVTAPATGSVYGVRSDPPEACITQCDYPPKCTTHCVDTNGKAVPPPVYEGDACKQSCPLPNASGEEVKPPWLESPDGTYHYIPGGEADGYVVAMPGVKWRNLPTDMGKAWSNLDTAQPLRRQDFDIHSFEGLDQYYRDYGAGLGEEVIVAHPDRTTTVVTIHHAIQPSCDAYIPPRSLSGDLIEGFYIFQVNPTGEALCVGGPLLLKYTIPVTAKTTMDKYDRAGIGYEGFSEDQKYALDVWIQQYFFKIWGTIQDMRSAQEGVLP